jgi:hypothetical protein
MRNRFLPQMRTADLATCFAPVAADSDEISVTGKQPFIGANQVCRPR